MNYPIFGLNILSGQVINIKAHALRFVIILMPENKWCDMVLHHFLCLQNDGNFDIYLIINLKAYYWKRIHVYKVKFVSKCEPMKRR